MKMFVALISGALLSSAAVAQHGHGASTGGTGSTREAREQAPANSGPRETAPADEGTERMICRRFDNTSSRLGRERVCKTAAQWRAYDRNN